MQQDTKWERQLPLSWTAYCVLPYHKTHSKSNSVVLLPAMWCYTCHLKTVHVILQKWLHRIVHLFLSFLKKTTFSFFPLIGAEEGGGKKSILKTFVHFQSRLSWLVRMSCVIWQQFWHQSYFLLLAYTKERAWSQYASTSDCLLVTYECCILAYIEQISKEFCS